MINPFLYVSKGLELIESGQFSEAEKSILEGISEYKKVKDNDGVTYALGRLGFCYEKAGLEDKAKEIYEKAVDLGTDIPATYCNLISILTLQGDLDRAFKVADIYQRNCPTDIQNPAQELFIQLSSFLIRDKKKVEAVKLLQRTLQYFPIDKYPSLFWQIRGLIGFAFEKAGDLESAMKLYREAIDEGSFDQNTFQRYLINLEKLKEFSTAVKFSEIALKIQKDVAWEADLKKRLQRLKLKTGQISKTSPKQVIEDYSIKRGAKYISLVRQVQFTPQLSHLVVDGKFFYGITGGKTPKLFCYRVETQERVWETALEGDPGGLTIANNRLIALTREGVIGGGHTKFFFFDLTGKSIAVQQIPDVFSEVSAYRDRLYAGCRDGKLYAFTTDGVLLWNYGLKNTQDQTDDNYSRPCPYYVSAGKDIVAFSSYGSLYVLNYNGKLLFQWNVPSLKETINVKSVSATISMPGGPISDLEVVPNSRKVLVSSQSKIIEIADGKVTRVVDTSPDCIFRIHISDNDVIYACGFDHALIIVNGEVQKKLLVSGLCDFSSNPTANRLAVWAGNKLSILSYSGVLLTEIEFVKTIHNVYIFNNGQILVATRYAILFDSNIKNIYTKPQVTTDQTPGELANGQLQPRFLEKVKPIEEDGFPIRWLEEHKISLEKGKAFYLGRDGKELTIEQTALQHYHQKGFIGGWTENNYWWEIMALLFWDVIFAKIPGTYTPQFGEFPSKLQDMPLDFFAPGFYLRRKKLIERRFQELNSTKFFGLVKKTYDSELRYSFQTNFGKPCRPIEDWNKYPFELLSLASQNLQKEQLTLILKRLLENFSENRKGLPDLFLINTLGKPLFVEVKAEKEKIADHQKDWHQFIKDVVNADMEICRVIDT